jgi:anti-sigma-K factor RskA
VNIKEYISSGIVESYVLGLASPEERTEFEQLCLQYPEVLEARTAFELSLEEQALAGAIPPPAGLKEKIWAAIQEEETTAATPVVAIDSFKRSAGKTNWLKYAAAACFILLAGSAYWNYSLYNSNKKLTIERDGYVAKLGDTEKDLKVLIGNPNIKLARLDGKEASPQSFTTVYWDTVSKDAWLMINNLPQPASDKQYQLWAFLDGQPIDIGLIENEYFIGQKQLLIKAKNVQKAQAFAITLEKKGRADVSKPEGTVYVLGNL